MSDYERRPGGSLVLWMLAGYGIGSLVGNVVQMATDNTPSDRVRDVQITNEQIYEQLETSRNVGDLVLNDSSHTFTFKDGVWTCTGSYEGEKEQAHVTGELDCAQTVPIG